MKWLEEASDNIYRNKMKNIIFVAVLLVLFVPWSVFGNIDGEQNVHTKVQLESENENQISKATPRIDEEAAMTVREKVMVSGEEKEIVSETRKKATYSEQFWVFIFGAYLFLIVFNLSFNFKKSQSIQWFWEALYTFLAVFVWDRLDFPRTNGWFPGAVMEAGIIIYLAYFYFLNNKIMTEKSSVDK